MSYCMQIHCDINFLHFTCNIIRKRLELNFALLLNLKDDTNNQFYVIATYDSYGPKCPLRLVPSKSRCRGTVLLWYSI